MYDTETLLSDEFTTFATAVAAISAAKKKAKEDLKKLVDEFQVNQKKLDEDVATLQKQFDEHLATKKKDKPAPVKKD